MKTKLYMLEETSEFIMSFVIITEKNNAVVIDGAKRKIFPYSKNTWTAGIFPRGF